MTQQEILEGNKLIAEFMGLKFGDDMFYCDADGERKQVAFHSSWDWLMPVVEKIGCIDEEWLKEKRCKEISTLMLCGVFISIEMLWKHVVQFIKWYNTQNPKP